LREAGVLPSLCGEARYDDQAEEVVAEAVSLLDERRNMQVVLLVLFIRGHRVRWDRLCEAYTRFYRTQLESLQHSSTAEDPFDVAEDVGRQLANKRTEETRQWKRRLDGRDESSTAIFESVNINMIRTFIEGRFPYEGSLREDALREFLDASGLSAAEKDSIGDIGPLTERLDTNELGEVLDLFNLEALDETLSHSSIDTFERARDSLLTMVRWVQAITEFLRRVSNLPDAMGFGAMQPGSELDLALQVPWIRALELRFPELVDHDHVESLAVQAELMEARLALLDAIPEFYWPLVLAPEKIEKLEDGEREALAAAIRHFETDNPELFALAVSDG